MKTSESIKTLTPAFLKAQKAIQSVIKDATNPYFKSKYADLTSVIDACKKHLNDQGIAILQPIDGMNVETILVHESGEWYSSSTPIVCKAQNDPQALGSAITYAKRYGLQSMVLLPAEDDDGNTATVQKSIAGTKVSLPKGDDDSIPDPTEEWPDFKAQDHVCKMHTFQNEPIQMKDRGKGIWDHRAQGYLLEDGTFEYSKQGDWYYCQGQGYIISKHQ